MKRIIVDELDSLEHLIYKTVRIVTNEGKVFEGKVTSYSSADDSDDGMEDIGIEYPDRVECFDRTMIRSIEESVTDQVQPVSIQIYTSYRFPIVGTVLEGVGASMDLWEEKDVDAFLANSRQLRLGNNTIIPITAFVPVRLNDKMTVRIGIGDVDFPNKLCPVDAVVE